MRDRFAIHHAAFDLADLAYCVRHKAFNFDFQRHLDWAAQSLLPDQHQRLARLVQMTLADLIGSADALPS